MCPIMKEVTDIVSWFKTQLVGVPEAHEGVMRLLWWADAHLVAIYNDDCSATASTTYSPSSSTTDSFATTTDSPSSSTTDSFATTTDSPSSSTTDSSAISSAAPIATESDIHIVHI